MNETITWRCECGYELERTADSVGTEYICPECSQRGWVPAPKLTLPPLRLSEREPKTDRSYARRTILAVMVLGVMLGAVVFATMRASKPAEQEISGEMYEQLVYVAKDFPETKAMLTDAMKDGRVTKSENDQIWDESQQLRSARLENLRKEIDQKKKDDAANRVAQWNDPEHQKKLMKDLAALGEYSDFIGRLAVDDEKSKWELGKVQTDAIRSLAYPFTDLRAKWDLAIADGKVTYGEAWEIVYMVKLRHERGEYSSSD